jgi:hypothetical protein
MRNIAALVLALVSACGAPMLRNAPRIESEYVAAPVAAYAIFQALLDLDGHAAVIEQAIRDATPIPKPIRVTEIVPADVLDRLDQTLAN